MVTRLKSFASTEQYIFVFAYWKGEPAGRQAFRTKVSFFCSTGFLACNHARSSLVGARCFEAQTAGTFQFELVFLYLPLL